MSDHEELESSVAAWVLGALEPEEAETIRSHAEACPTCREVAQRLRRVVGALPLAVEEVAPPARLRARVLAAAAASRPEASRVVATRRRVPAVRRPVLPRVGSRVPAYALAAVAVVSLLAGLLIGQVAFRGSTPAPASQVARFTLTGHQDMSGARAMVIDLRSDGVALVNRSVSGYSVMAVTNEAGPDGAPAPTQQPQLYGNLA